MKTLQVCVRKVSRIRTKYGDRVLIECLNYGERINILRMVGDEFSSHLMIGDIISVVEDEGKYFIEEKPQRIGIEEDFYHPTPEVMAIAV